MWCPAGVRVRDRAQGGAREICAKGFDCCREPVGSPWGHWPSQRRVGAHGRFLLTLHSPRESKVVLRSRTILKVGEVLTLHDPTS